MASHEMEESNRRATQPQAHEAESHHAYASLMEESARQMMALDHANGFPVVYGPQENGSGSAVKDESRVSDLYHQLPQQLREQFGHLFPSQLPIPKKGREGSWTSEMMEDFAARARMWELAVEKVSNGHMRVAFTDGLSGVPEVRTRCDTCGDVIRTRARYFVRDAVFDHIASSKHISNVTISRVPAAAAIVGPHAANCLPPNAVLAASSAPGAHDGPCSAICLGFGFRDNLVRGPDYRTKAGQLLFTINPDFRGRRCVCHGGQVADDGSAFGRGDYECAGTAINPSGVCDGCDRASKLHVARQRRYYRCNRNDVCGRRATARKRKGTDTPEGTVTRTRRTNAPAGSEAARRHAPAYVLGSSHMRGSSSEPAPTCDPSPVGGSGKDAESHAVLVAAAAMLGSSMAQGPEPAPTATGPVMGPMLESGDMVAIAEAAAAVAAAACVASSQ